MTPSPRGHSGTWEGVCLITKGLRRKSQPPAKAANSCYNAFEQPEDSVDLQTHTTGSVSHCGVMNDIKINWNSMSKPSVVILPREEPLAKMLVFKILVVTRVALIRSKVSKEEKEWIKKRRRRRRKQSPTAEVVLVSLSSQVWTGDH